MKISTDEVSRAPDAKLPVPEPLEDLTAGLGQALMEIREKKGITQSAVARAVGLNRTSITNIEAGKQKLSVYHLARIADALGVEVQIAFKDKT